MWQSWSKLKDQALKLSQDVLAEAKQLSKQVTTDDDGEAKSEVDEGALTIQDLSSDFDVAHMLAGGGDVHSGFAEVPATASAPPPRALASESAATEPTSNVSDTTAPQLQALQHVIVQLTKQKETVQKEREEAQHAILQLKAQHAHEHDSRVKENQSLLKQIEQLEQKLDGSSAFAETLEHTIDTLRQDAATGKLESSDLRQELELTRKAKAKLEQQLNDLSQPQVDPSVVASREAEIVVLNERLQQSERALADAVLTHQQQVQSLQAELQQARAEGSQLESSRNSEIASLQSQLQSTRAQAEAAENSASLDRAALQAEVASLHSQLATATEQERLRSAAHDTELRTLREQLVQIAAVSSDQQQSDAVVAVELRRMQQQLSDSQTAVEQLKAGEKQAQDVVARLQAQVTEYMSQKAAAEQQIVALQSSIDELQKQLSNVQRELQNANSERELTLQTAQEAMNDSDERISNLQKQLDDAHRQYAGTKAELDSVRTLASQHSIGQQQQQDARVIELERLLSESTQSTQQLQHEVADKQRAVDAAERELEAARADRASCVSQQDHQNALDALQQQLNTSAQLASEQAMLLQTQQQAHQQSEPTLSAQLEALEAKQKEQAAEYDVERKRMLEKLALAEAERFKLVEELDSTRQQLAHNHLADKVEELEQACESLQVKNKSLQRQVDSRCEAVAELQRQLSESRSGENIALQQQRDAATSAYAALQRALETAKQEHSAEAFNLREAVARLEAECRVLKETHTAELSESKAQVTKMESQLSRLRQRLIDTQQEQEQELLRRDEEVKQLTQRAVEAGAAQALQGALAQKTAECERQATALSNLEGVMLTFQLEAEQARIQLRERTQQLAQVRTELAKVQDNEQAIAAQRTAQLDETLRERNAEIERLSSQMNQLREELATTRRALDNTAERLRITIADENTIDRRLMIKMLVSYFTDGSRQTEVLNLISRILQMTDEDKAKIPQLAPRSRWLFWGGGTAPPTNADGLPTSPSLSEQWVDFLLRNAAQTDLDPSDSDRASEAPG
eukprot:TRINITY_DN9767_c0_g1_i1.p1 TRINITY_DN9767_c0_g1~~TRINITY_DN9767_c0_g1_i1.p1  ORF type:complete len:1036 (-),score=304.63 TRINITY_DN9767_c0_g1_i1:22-3129(-)